MGELDKICWVGVLEFSVFYSFKRTSFILGCENWETYDFKALLRLVKSLLLRNLDTRKNELYGDQDGTGETSGCSCSCPQTEDLTSAACVRGYRANGVSTYDSDISIIST